ncbi:uncharacterized protein [Typha angustifolia]|uniref:uncharacterized protein isoform X1 n=1 Tax=Typha angustifolia TaxID=59011 RepID=UPI003C2ACA5C
MYADKVVAGAKRSIRDRLYGGISDDLGRMRSDDAKRYRQNDGTWRHELHTDSRGPQFSKAEVGIRDLRVKFQRKDSQPAYQVGKVSGVQDLRDRLSGTMRPQPANAGLLKPKPIQESAKPAGKRIPPVEATNPVTKNVTAPTTSRKQGQEKAELSVDNLLNSLGLEKYTLTFQAEEVDMTALKHMTDADLKSLGIPMGPRKKILLALNSRT